VQRGDDVRYQPTHFTILSVDVARSGLRNDELQLKMRRDLRTIIAEALAELGLDQTGVVLQDLGDGLRLLAPACVTPVALLDPLVPRLAAGLRAHRRSAADGARLRLRAALHTGLLHRDALGWAGSPLVHCTRLLDAAPVRRVLDAADDVDLVLAVSQTVYDTVLRQGNGLDVSAYRPVTFRAKETVATAWLHVPGYPAPPGVDAQPPTGSPQPGDAATTAPADDPRVVFQVRAGRDAYNAVDMTVYHGGDGHPVTADPSA
jgi:hypothetical protein